jgi:hypothetical protein
VPGFPNFQSYGFGDKGLDRLFERNSGRPPRRWGGPSPLRTPGPLRPRRRPSGPAAELLSLPWPGDPAVVLLRQGKRPGRQGDADASSASNRSASLKRTVLPAQGRRQGAWLEVSDTHNSPGFQTPVGFCRFCRRGRLVSTREF